MEHQLQADDETSVVIPVSQMQGRVVWTQAGRRLGTIRAIHTEESGRIAAFDVRDRWIFGEHHHVVADGMRIEQGDIIVPEASIHPMPEQSRAAAALPNTESVSAPVLVAGREGARQRYGGLDPLGGLAGSLAAIATLAMLGSLFAAIFDTGLLQVETTIVSFDGLGATTLLVTAATIIVAGFVGGWVAGRASRFDGAANGVLSVACTISFGLVFAVAGWAAGDQYDVLAGSVVPRIALEDVAWAGVLAFIAVTLVMLVVAVAGGMLGASWHRRADHAMLEVVPYGE